MLWKRGKKCACCRKFRFEPDARHEICPVCGWEQDSVQEKEPDFAGGANHLSLKEARAEYKARVKKEKTCGATPATCEEGEDVAATCEDKENIDG